MVQSMTGFGSAEQDGCRVEIRSLNQKFLDITIKAPSSLSQLDIFCRNSIKELFSRGKFDVSISLSGESSAALRINTELVGRILGTFRQLQADLAVPGTIDINSLMGLHEKFIETEQHIDSEMVTIVFRTALGNLHDMRLKEGACLAVALQQLTDTVLEMREKISSLCGRVTLAAHEKFNERIRTLLEGKDIDSTRMLQEAAIMAAKIDIAEELTRLGSHIIQFRETLSLGGSIGRKLDFILQECNREVNTIASKSVDYEISSITVDMKTAIEQLREQVQNIQ
ncbi:MAG: YicC family protein [Thermodesulfovibrio sp.]|nr:YicC family protein [Thermodesulfovibrio sp.]